MGTPSKAVAFLSLILCVRQNLSEGSSSLAWTCLCAAAAGTNASSPLSNCSTACRCAPEFGIGGADGEGWTCLCSSPEHAPQEQGLNNIGCFTSCNCTSAPSPSDASASPEKKQLSQKPLVLILLLCVISATIAFLSLASYCACRKPSWRIQLPAFSSDGDPSSNRESDFLCHQASLLPKPPNSGLHPTTGSERRASLCCIAQFSYAELERATGGFSEENLVGSGGSSDVYRGRLTDGRFVAIKKLKLAGCPGADSEFMTEIELISKLNHRHVVPLLGYCVERRQKSSQRLLVLEYMPNGSLRDSLDVQSGGKPIDWGARVGIALGVARGLEYLHEAAAPRILHRDVKSGNILLDDLFTAKITDLGMAKRLTSDELAGCSSSPARMLGTFGYFAPECAITGRASLKSDVFSFGVVVLELITGRRPIHRAKNQGEESLVIWAAPLLRSSKLAPSELPDPLLRGSFPEEEMLIIARLARECLQWDADSRPSMSEVVQVLSAIAPGRPRRRTLSTSVTMSSSPDIGESGSEAELELRGVNPGVTRATALTAITVLTPPRRWTADDEESVDLTEPQFKSFIQEVVCITIQ